jgi:hypothetical protein
VAELAARYLRALAALGDGDGFEACGLFPDGTGAVDGLRGRARCADGWPGGGAWASGDGLDGEGCSLNGSGVPKEARRSATDGIVGTAAVGSGADRGGDGATRVNAPVAIGLKADLLSGDETSTSTSPNEERSAWQETVRRTRVGTSVKAVSVKRERGERVRGE